MKVSKMTFAAMALALGLWAGNTAMAQTGGAGNGNSGGNSARGGQTMQNQSARGGNGGGQSGAIGGNAGGGNGNVGASGGGAGMGSGGGNSASMGNGGAANAGYLMGHFHARVPQYWISDASIFIGNAANTARVLEQEQKLDVQDPQIFASQSRFLRNATARSLNDISGLLSNAMQTDPNAVPAIRGAQAELQAATAQANAFAADASRGDLGPNYIVTVRSALAHLNAAEQAMNKVAGSYHASNFALSASNNGRP